MRLHLLFITMAALILSGCSVNIRDHEICGDMGASGAACFHTLTSDSRELDKATWDTYRVGKLCEDADAFADWKAAMEKLCSQTGDCTYEQKQQMDIFFSRVETFQRNLADRLSEQN